ncbi:hypothetical protein E2542_SST24693 [Spatholobus suberectus]|nr:hypothetical protein E2542_SST24693 [Spatholobus suberectus]
MHTWIASSTRRSSSHNGSPHFHAWERDHLTSLSLSHVYRDSSWRAYHHANSRLDPSTRSNNFRLRHG